MKNISIRILCILISLISVGGIYQNTFAVDSGIRINQNDLLVGNGVNSANESTNVTFKDNFLKNIQKYMMGLVGIVSVSVFLYIGYMLFTAQGKEEDFKNAWKALVYAVIGLAVMPLAYILVKIVTGFTF